MLQNLTILLEAFSPSTLQLHNLSKQHNLHNLFNLHNLLQIHYLVGLIMLVLHWHLQISPKIRVLHFSNHKLLPNHLEECNQLALLSQPKMQQDSILTLLHLELDLQFLINLNNNRFHNKVMICDIFRNLIFWIVKSRISTSK